MSSEPPSSIEWVKSSYSYGAGECVEVAEFTDGTVGMRDSKAPDSALLRFTRGEMLAFVRGVQSGEFDRFC